MQQMMTMQLPQQPRHIATRSPQSSPPATDSDTSVVSSRPGFTASAVISVPPLNSSLSGGNDASAQARTVPSTLRTVAAAVPSGGAHSGAGPGVGRATSLQTAATTMQQTGGGLKAPPAFVFDVPPVTPAAQPLYGAPGTSYGQPYGNTTQPQMQSQPEIGRAHV